MRGGWPENLLVTCLNLRPGERVLVLVDEPLRQAGEALCAAAGDLGAGSVVLQSLPPVRRLNLISERWLRPFSLSHVIISLLSDLRLSHEPAALRAAVDAFTRARLGRWAFGAYVDAAMFQQELLADCAEVARHARELAHRLAGVDQVRLQTAAGTDLTFRIGGRPLRLETGLLIEPGAFGNLPGGEVFVAPLENSAEGTLVVDLALGDIPLSEPVALHFRAGRVVATEGGPASAELAIRLGSDHWAWTMGEFGLGANRWARRCGPVTVAEKALGTAHVALGGNTAFGGRNPAATHYDCVVDQPLVLLDGKPLEPA